MHDADVRRAALVPVGSGYARRSKPRLRGCRHRVDRGRVARRLPREFEPATHGGRRLLGRPLAARKHRSGRCGRAAHPFGSAARGVPTARRARRRADLRRDAHLPLRRHDAHRASGRRRDLAGRGRRAPGHRPSDRNRDAARDHAIARTRRLHRRSPAKHRTPSPARYDDLVAAD